MNEIQNKLLTEYNELILKIYKAQEYLKENQDTFLTEQVKHMTNYAIMVKVRLGITLVDDLLAKKSNEVKNKKN